LSVNHWNVHETIAPKIGYDGLKLYGQLSDEFSKLFAQLA